MKRFRKFLGLIVTMLVILSLTPLRVPLAQAGGLGNTVTLSNPWEQQSGSHTITFAAGVAASNLDKIVLQYSYGPTSTQVPVGLVTTASTLGSLTEDGTDQTANWNPVTSTNGQIVLTATTPIAAVSGSDQFSVRLDNVVNSKVTNNPSPCDLSNGGTVDNCWLDVSAYDSAGTLLTNTSATYSVVAGNAPLTLQVSSPSMNGETVSGNQAVSVSIQNVNPVSKVELYADNALVSTSTTAPFTNYWNTTGLANGSQHSIYALAYDSLGNSAHSETVQVLADTQPPTTSISSPSNNSYVSGSVPIVATATDALGIGDVEFYIDGHYVGYSSTAPYTYNWDTSGLANGSKHNLTVYTEDPYGNGTFSSPVTVYIGTASSDTTPPTISLTSPTANSSVTGTVQIGATASDNVAVSRVDFSVDGTVVGSSNATPYSYYSWNTSGLAANSKHTLTVTAYDPSGNTASASETVTVSDTTAPTVSIIAPGNGSVVSGTVSVQATASDNVGVTNVVFSVDGQSFSSITTAPYTAAWNTAGLAANTQHVIAVTAYDSAGNSSSSSETVSIADTTLPSASLTSPYNGQGVSGSVQLSAAATDNVGVTKVEFYVGTTLISTTTTAPYTATWDTSSLPQGSTQSIQVKAYDAAGNVGTSVPVSVTILDTTAPTISLTNPQSNTMISGQVAITANASDNIAVKEVQILVDGQVATTLTAAPYIYNWDTSQLVQGSGHTIAARAFDTSGNITTSNLVTVTVADTTAPTVSIDSPAGGSTVSGTVDLSYGASDNIGVTKVEYYIDGTLVGTGITAPYHYSWNTVGLANGTVHTLAAKAYDTAGNVGTVSEIVSVADITAPSLSLINPVDGSTVSRSTTVTLQATASDISGIAKVEFYVNGILLATDTHSPYTASWVVGNRKGITYTITAKAYDTAGNFTSHSVTVVSR